MRRGSLQSYLMPITVAILCLTTPALAEPLPTLDQSVAAIADPAPVEAEPTDIPLPASFLLLLVALGGFVVLTGRTD